MKLILITILMIFLFLHLAIATIPVTTLESPADNTITNETSISFNCSATENLELANMTLYNNISGTFDLIETINITGTSNSTILTDVIIHNNSIIWNCNACDTFNNCDFGNSNFSLRINQTFPFIDHIHLVTPLNNSIDTDGLVTFKYKVEGDPEHIHDYNLVIDGVINKTESGIAGFNTFSALRFLNNKSIVWNVNSTEDMPSENFNLIVNITNSGLIEDQYSVTICPATTPRVLLFLGFVAIVIVFIIIGFMLEIGAVGFLGSLGLMVLSWYMFSCIRMYGLVILLFSIFLMAYFLVTGLSFGGKDG